MNREVLVSVIIPVYNVAEWLPQCLDSVLGTDFNDYEIILVDDGSTDGKSGTICDEYAEKHPDLIKVIHQKNAGLGGARNTGIEQAVGEYLLFVDSDDYIDSSLLNDIFVYIEKYHSDIYMFGRYLEINGDVTENIIDHFSFDSSFSLASQPSVLLSSPSAWGRLWKRELFIKNDIRFPGRVWYEDIRTSLKLFAYADSIVNLEKPYYYYRIRENSIMSSNNISRNGEIIDAIEDVISFYERHGLKDKYYDELCFLTLDNVMIYASVRVLMQDAHHPLLDKFVDYTIDRFPDYANNPYIQTMPRNRRIIMSLISNRRFGLAALLLKGKKWLKSLKS